MATTTTRRWVASLTAVVVLVASINCVCANAMPAASKLAVQVTTPHAPASHACCQKGPQEARRHSKPSQDHDTQCPHCNGSMAGAVAVKEASARSCPSPDGVVLFCTIDWHAPLLLSAIYSYVPSHTPSSFVPLTTLLSLNCALTT